jgi:hypothetical protein
MTGWPFAPICCAKLALQKAEIRKGCAEAVRFKTDTTADRVELIHTTRFRSRLARCRQTPCHHKRCALRRSIIGRDDLVRCIQPLLSIELRCIRRISAQIAFLCVSQTSGREIGHSRKPSVSCPEVRDELSPCGKIA